MINLQKSLADSSSCLVNPLQHLVDIKLQKEKNTFCHITIKLLNKMCSVENVVADA
jgi:hypothetical protein